MKVPLAVVIGILLCIAAGSFADVVPHSLFSDNMVLQRDLSIPVWGKAQNGEKVTVEFCGQTVSTTAHNGMWFVRLTPEPAGGPFTMKIVGSNAIELKNVMVGDVWLCGGQSNMQFGLKESIGGDIAAEGADKDQLRLFTVPVKVSNSPQYTIDSAWQISNKATAEGFSAVGYYFGRYLKTHQKVPIGLINCCCGATSAEAWMSKDMLQADKRFADAYLAPDYKPGWFPLVPMIFYNGMINAVVPYGIKGAIWYQGESNAGGAYLYRDLFPAMVKGWREKWGEGDIPFYYVQLAPFEASKHGPEPGDSNWAELREAQLLALKKISNSGMAVITDVGNATDIHPKDKQPVGERLALLSLKQDYGQKVECYSPVYKSVKHDGEKLVVRFDNAYAGLKTSGSAPKGFAVAGVDGKYQWAEAEIKGKDSVAVWSASVPNPVSVRYGWADCPSLNLFNSAGLPASPFRTDSLPILTQPK